MNDALIYILIALVVILLIAVLYVISKISKKSGSSNETLYFNPGNPDDVGFDLLF